MDARTHDETAAEEGRRFGRYLLGGEPPATSVDLYVAAMRRLTLQIPEKDQSLLRFMQRHAWSIGFVDGGLALRRPSSVIRTRLLVMSAILEANPQLATVFLPSPQPAAYVGYAAFVAFRAGLRAAIGTLLVAWI